MFSLKVCIRKFSNTASVMTRVRKGSNPGVTYQINAIEDAVDVIQSDPEGFAGLESDLLNVHQSHKEHELDLKRQKEKIKQHMIKNKYFRKEPLPNLLTFSEKEHIRFLHSTDSEEWTIEKLAESFPANAEIISKILKAHWTPISLKGLHSHDVGVAKNWERFNNGAYKANMTSELYEHLKKFSDRGANDMKIDIDPSKFLNKSQWKKPISKEFLSIVSKRNEQIHEVKKLKALPPKSIANEIRAKSDDSETYLIGERKNKKLVTLHEFKNKHSLKTAEDSMLKNSLDQLTSQQCENPNGTEMMVGKNTSICSSTDYTDKFTLDEIVIDEFDRKRYEISSTKERIWIPRKLWRKGATYRTNNCYYDDDGEFLYKVPEMSFK